MSKPVQLGICFTTLMLTPIANYAAPVEEATVGDKGSVRVLGIDIIPELKVDLANTDNLLKSDTNKLSSTHALVRPSATAHIQHGLSVMEAEIAAEENYFTNTGEWDYDYEAVDTNFKGDFDLTPRNRVNLTAQYLLTQENPGEGFSQGVQVRSRNTVMLDGNTFPHEDIDLHAGYEFGHRDATGRIEVYGDGGRVHYSETRALPYNPDRKSNGFGGRFHLRLTAKTALLFGAGQRTVRYDDYLPLDSDEKFWELGASFNPSAVFQFDARAGQNERTLVNDNDRETKAPSYNVTATWSPLTYSRFTLGATQSFQESSGYGAFTKTQAVNAEWTHDWNSRFGSFVRLQKQNETTEAGNGGLGISENAESKVSSAQIGVSYLQRRWLKWELSGSKNVRDSDIDLLDYHERLVQFSVLLTL